MRALFAKLARDVPAMLGLGIVLFVLLLAVFGPWLAPYPGDAAASHLLRRLKPPSAEFPFGTDNLGRDIFSRVILGARGALAIALTVVGVAMLIGVPLGLLAGYRGGWLSETEYFMTCNTTWGELMYRLKAAAEGKSRAAVSCQRAGILKTTIYEIGVSKCQSLSRNHFSLSAGLFLDFEEQRLG